MSCEDRIQPSRTFILIKLNQVLKSDVLMHLKKAENWQEKKRWGCNTTHAKY